MSGDYIYYGPETAALEIGQDGKVQRVIPRAITVEKGSATQIGDGFDEHRQYDQDLRDAYAMGRDDALDAAREAVLSLVPEIWREEPHVYEMNANDAISVIDALRKGNK